MVFDFSDTGDDRVNVVGNTLFKFFFFFFFFFLAVLVFCNWKMNLVSRPALWSDILFSKLFCSVWSFS